MDIGRVNSSNPVYVYTRVILKSYCFVASTLRIMQPHLTMSSSWKARELPMFDPEWMVSVRSLTEEPSNVYDSP